MSKFETVAYFAAWKKEGIRRTKYEYLTQINYAFAIPTVDGEVLPLEYPEVVQRLIKEAHEHDTKVLISLGGWSWLDIPLEDTFVKATETPEKTRKLVDSIMAVVDEYGFDGIDVDWEYPRKSRGSDKQNEYLVELLAERLHAQGKLLTVAVIGGCYSLRTDLDHPDVQASLDVCAGYTDKALALYDQINIMAYDGGDEAAFSSYEMAVSCAEYWRDHRGIPGEKITLGVPFYGRPGGSYTDLFAFDGDADKTDNVDLGNGKVSWHNGIPTMRKKTRYAKDTLGGIMIWEIAQDAMNPEKSLLKAIYDEANK